MEGEVWNAVSSQIIPACLKCVSAGQRRVGGSRENGDVFISVISVDASTARVPSAVRQTFMEYLQDTL